MDQQTMATVTYMALTEGHQPAVEAEISKMPIKPTYCHFMIDSQAAYNAH